MSFTFCWLPCGVGGCLGICCLLGSLPARFLRSQDGLGAFLDSLLAQSKLPRLPVDRVGCGSFFTVGNDFISKTFPPQGSCFSALLWEGLHAQTGAARSRSRHLTSTTGSITRSFSSKGRVEQGGEVGPVWDVGRSSLFSVHVCFYLETTCSPSFFGILIR